MNKVAKLVSRSLVRPVFTHDCGACRFLGRLDGHDLYFCPTHGEYSARYGNEPHQYSSLGDFTPPGSPVSLARQLNERHLPPRAYRSAPSTPPRGVRVVAAGDGSIFRA